MVKAIERRYLEWGREGGEKDRDQTRKQYSEGGVGRNQTELFLMPSLSSIDKVAGVPSPLEEGCTGEGK